MVKFWVILLLFVAFLISGCSSASVSPVAKIVGGVVTNVASALFKWLWSLKSTTKTEVSSRSMMKFEGGYTVETVFDGSKLGIDPYYVEVSPSGNLLILDSQNSNIYSISTPFSRYSRPKLIAGSPEGYSGHIDGKPREARMNHPRGFTMDDRGNLYVADTMNMAIRKISDYGVVTIAGGKWSRGGGGHIDGPSEDAKFSDDFDVVYVGSSCSLLIVDRGNQAIREIQLRDDDCPEKYDESAQLVSGVAVLFAAAFFGYMLALLQRRIVAMFSYDSIPKVHAEGMPAGTYLRHHKSIRPPLIPTDEGEYEKSGEGLFDSMGKLIMNAGSSMVEILGGLFSGSRRKRFHHPNQHHFRDTSRHSNPWPSAMQESFVIPDEDEPPSLESSRDQYPTPRKPYPVMMNEMENSRYSKQNQPFYGGRNVDFPQQQQQQHHHQVQQFKKQQQQQQQQHYQKHQQSDTQTYYEQDCEKKEIVFGAVQEEDDRREAMVIKSVHHHEDPFYSNYNIRSRYNYTGYSYGY